MESTGKSGAVKVCLDANMLLSIEQLKIDVFFELKKLFGKVEFFVPEQVLGEFEILEKSNKTKKKEVKIARILLEKNNAKILKSEAEKADDSLLEIASKGFLIATNDQALRKKIKSLGGKIIYLKKKKLLEIE